MSDDAFDAAARALYRLPPDRFTTARAEAVDDAADEDLARAIRGLRKPTVAAWVVNAHAFAEPEVVTALTALGDELRQAQADLDGARMRELAARRRALVAAATSEALTAADRSDAGASLRDDVSATFDAAVADTGIASRLGLLQRAEHWSGFGFSSGSAELTLVPADADTDPGSPDDVEAARSAAARDTDALELRQALDTSRHTLAGADADLDAARAAEDTLTHRIARMTTRLTTLQNDLDQARRMLAEARTSTKRARESRRSAQTALNRLERR